MKICFHFFLFTFFKTDANIQKHLDVLFFVLVSFVSVFFFILQWRTRFFYEDLLNFSFRFFTSLKYGTISRIKILNMVTLFFFFHFSLKNKLLFIMKIWHWCRQFLFWLPVLQFLLVFRCWYKKLFMSTFVFLCVMAIQNRFQKEKKICLHHCYYKTYDLSKLKYKSQRMFN